MVHASVVKSLSGLMRWAGLSGGGFVPQNSLFILRRPFCLAGLVYFLGASYVRVFRSFIRGSRLVANFCLAPVACVLPVMSDSP